MDVPETRYAKTDDGVHIAYQVIGSGPIDLVFVAEWASHVRAAWDMPWMARGLARLSSFTRLICFDKRGTGMSDPLPPTSAGGLDERMDDMCAVVEGAHSEQTAVFGAGLGAPCAILFAATHPERVAALVVLNGMARGLRDEDYHLPRSVDGLSSGASLSDSIRALVPCASPERGPGEPAPASRRAPWAPLAVEKDFMGRGAGRLLHMVPKLAASDVHSLETPRPLAATLRHRFRQRWGTIGAHLVSLVAVQLMLVIGLITYASVQDFKSARIDAVARASTIARVAADKVSQALKDNADQLAQIPQFTSVLRSPGYCSIVRASNTPDPTSIHDRTLLLHLDGRAACAGQAGYVGSSWVKQARVTSRPVTVGPLLDSATGKYAEISALRVPGFDLIGAFALDLSSMAGVLTNQLASGSMPIDIVLAPADRSVALSTTAKGSDPRLAGTPFSRPVTKGKESFIALSGEQRTYAEAVVPGFGWHLYAGYKTADALHAASTALKGRIALAVLMIAVVVSIAFVIQRRFVRPIRSLSRVTKRIAEGDLGATATPSGPVELVALGESFNTMIGERKKAEAALRRGYAAERRATKELRAIDEMRNAFLMAISHEVCTPLTSVVGFSSYLTECRDTVTDVERDEGLEAIASQSKRLERLLLDLLDVDRLTRGAIEPSLADTDVRELVRHVVNRASVSRKIVTDMRGPIRASIDSALVERIVENLVVNAVKHTPAGTKIWVRAARRNGHLKLVVEDSGKGVPDELKLAIFEPFKQGDVPSHSPGTGIGLSLVGHFATLHGGRAWVEDRSGGGASFHVELPAVEHKTNGSDRRTRPHGSDRKAKRRPKS